MALAASLKKSKTSSFEMPIAKVLLDSGQFAFVFFLEHFMKKWQIRIHPYREADRFGMIVDGRVIGCELVHTPVTEEALTQNARDNVLWPEAVLRISKHKAHLNVAMAREGSPVAAHIAFTKVIYNLAREKNVLGIYLAPGLFEPEYYIKCAESLTVNKMPTELWVHINQMGFEQGEHYTFFTTGMGKFGKKEFEIIETKMNFIDAYYSLKELIKYAIEYDITFKDGDTIRAEAGNEGSLNVSVSKGFMVKGTTVKIGL